MKIVNIHEAKTKLSALLAEVEEKGEDTCALLWLAQGRGELSTAQVHHMPVVTADPIFAPYGIEIIS